MSIRVFCSLSFSILLVICGKIVTLMLLETAKMLIGRIVSIRTRALCKLGKVINSKRETK